MADGVSAPSEQEQKSQETTTGATVTREETAPSQETSGQEWTSSRRTGRRAQPGINRHPEAVEELRVDTGVRAVSERARESNGEKLRAEDENEGREEDQETLRDASLTAESKQKKQVEEPVIPVTVLPSMQAQTKHSGRVGDGGNKRLVLTEYVAGRDEGEDTEDDIALLEYLSGTESDYYEMDRASRKGEDGDNKTPIMALSPRSEDESLGTPESPGGLLSVEEHGGFGLSPKNNESETALHIAAKHGYLGVVRSLLAYGASTKDEDAQGRTPLILSILENHVECVQLLQSVESTTNPTSSSTATPPYRTSPNTPESRPGSGGERDALAILHSYLFQLLASHTAAEAQTVYQLVEDVRGQISALSSSVQASSDREARCQAQIDEMSSKLAATTEEVKKEKGLHSDTQNRLGVREIELEANRVSHRALTSRCELLESIARNAQEKLGRERSEHARDEEAMQEKLPDLEARDETGNTPLLAACLQGNFDCARFLLQSAVSLRAVNENGDSALHLAAWDGSIDCVMILLEYGIDPMTNNRFGLTALGNMKTRSPMRHKFDDLPEDHPMRRTLVVLEEAELQNRQTIQEQSGNDQATIEHKTQLARQESSSSASSSRKASWTQWLLGFRGPSANGSGTRKPESEEQRKSESNDASTSATTATEENEVDSEDADDLASYEESRLAMDEKKYERLTPPPEVEEALRRAKAYLLGGENEPNSPAAAPTHPLTRQDLAKHTRNAKSPPPPAPSTVVPNYNVMGPAKAALEATARQLAFELGPEGIRVNCLSPGPMNTVSARGIPGISKMRKYAQDHAPLRQNSSSGDVGSLAAFLASDLSKSITGQTIYVDGGLSAMAPYARDD
ncbi:hypothetical protein PHYBOEH_008763 [Phytophthora boehmeriae]|uniref:Uncharacterized protein n=1 Tax=Phytophthora boehmeriae TaxID=109152 RepID=A0A8T1W293_9STRA|nr:hypothetical protein PHYBOEH_008763 [Phytophthora boehmeriae]